jgi:hypothetical protein
VPDDLVVVEVDGGVPLGTGLRGAAGSRQSFHEPLLRLPAEAVQLVVEHGDVSLLVAEVGMFGTGGAGGA